MKQGKLEGWEPIMPEGWAWLRPESWWSRLIRWVTRKPAPEVGYYFARFEYCDNKETKMKYFKNSTGTIFKTELNWLPEILLEEFATMAVCSNYSLWTVTRDAKHLNGCWMYSARSSVGTAGMTLGLPVHGHAGLPKAAEVGLDSTGKWVRVKPQMDAGAVARAIVEQEKMRQEPLRAEVRAQDPAVDPVTQEFNRETYRRVLSREPAPGTVFSWGFDLDADTMRAFSRKTCAEACAEACAEIHDAVERGKVADAFAAAGIAKDPRTPAERMQDILDREAKMAEAAERMRAIRFFKGRPAEIREVLEKPWADVETFLNHDLLVFSRATPARMWWHLTFRSTYLRAFVGDRLIRYLDGAKELEVCPKAMWDDLQQAPASTTGPEREAELKKAKDFARGLKPDDSVLRDIPTDIVEFARRVSEWFDRAGGGKWALGGVCSRLWESEWDACHRTNALADKKIAELEKQARVDEVELAGARFTARLASSDDDEKMNRIQVLQGKIQYLESQLEGYRKSAVETQAENQRLKETVESQRGTMSRQADDLLRLDREGNLENVGKRAACEGLMAVAKALGVSGAESGFHIGTLSEKLCGAIKILQDLVHDYTVLKKHNLDSKRLDFAEANAIKVMGALNSWPSRVGRDPRTLDFRGAIDACREPAKGTE